MEQISEEFAIELIRIISTSYKENVTEKRMNTEIFTLNNWKNAGFIKKSREEEIRLALERLNKITSIPENHIPSILRTQNNLLLELIEILDNKLKR